MKITPAKNIKDLYLVESEIDSSYKVIVTYHSSDPYTSLLLFSDGHEANNDERAAIIEELKTFLKKRANIHQYQLLLQEF